MSAKRAPSPNDDELALLSAFLDGELSTSDEASLLNKLSQRPDLQDALDDLADVMASAQRAFADAITEDAAADAFGGLISARVMAELDPGALPTAPEFGREAVETLTSLAQDGASSTAQDRRLEQLLATPALADAAASFVAASDVARAAINVASDDHAFAVARGLAQVPEHVLARVERTERGWALATGAVDGQLSDAEVNELAGLCGADDDVYAALAFETSYARFPGEALRAATDSAAFLVLAEKAGAAALEAINAVELQTKTQATATLQKATSTTSSTSSSTSSSTTATAAAPTLADRVRALFSQGFAPLLAASAALVLFVVVGKSEPQTTANPDASAFAALQQAFVDAAAPIVLADNRAVANGELAVLGDNSADVEAIDATGTTMVFSTAESNITIIWVDGLDSDSEKEQGT